MNEAAHFETLHAGSIKLFFPAEFRDLLSGMLSTNPELADSIRNLMKQIETVPEDDVIIGGLNEYYENPVYGSTSADMLLEDIFRHFDI